MRNAGKFLDLTIIRPKDPITYSRNDFELLEVSLLREMLRLQFEAEAHDPKVR